MSFKPASLIAGGLVAVTVLSGCVGRYESDFPVVVVNKAANTIQVLANGNELGAVAAGQMGAFSIRLPETNPNVFTNGVAPTPQAEVTFSAKDMKTGAFSSDKSMTLSQDTPTHVTFSAADFPSTGPTVARFTFSPPNPSNNQDVFFNASSSTVSNGTFAWDFGDGQTGSGVTVTHQYSPAGTFIVTLTVTSDSGVSSTASRTINVSTNLPSIPSDPYGDVIGTCGALRQSALVVCVNNFIHGHDETSDFEVVKRMAWILRGEGGGMLIKTSGDNIITWRGYSFSTSRVCVPLDHFWKIFTDAGPGGANTPTWTDNGPVSASGSSCVPAIDPTLP